MRVLGHPGDCLYLLTAPVYRGGINEDVRVGASGHERRDGSQEHQLKNRKEPYVCCSYRPVYSFHSPLHPHYRVPYLCFPHLNSKHFISEPFKPGVADDLSHWGVKGQSKLLHFDGEGREKPVLPGNTGSGSETLGRSGACG